MLDNLGTMTDSQTGADINFDNDDATPGVLNNSGTFNVTAGGGYYESYSTGADAINNSGVWNVSGAGITSLVGSNIAFNNTGSVNVTSGTLELDGGGTSTGGIFLVSAGAGLNFGGGGGTIYTLSGASSVSGAGTVLFEGNGGLTWNFNAGTYSVTGTTSITAGTINFNSAASTTWLDLSGGVLSGSGLVSTPSLNWTGGNMEGTGTTSVLDPVSTISGNGGIGLDRVLNNMGTITDSQTGANFNFDNDDATPGVLNNSGTFNVTAGDSFTESYGHAGDAINNSGVWNVSGAGMTSSVGSNIAFNNTGSVNVISGTLELSGTITQHSGSELTGGTWDVFNGSTLLFNDGGSAITTNNGDVTLGGPTAVFAAIDSITANGGALRILGDANFTAASSLTNSGTLQLGGGTFGATSLVSDSGSEIFGFGTISAPVQLNSFAVIEPGAAGMTGTLTISDALTLGSNAEYAFNLNSTGGGAGDGSSELIAASATLDAGCQLTFDDIAATPGKLTPGDEFIAFQTADGFTGVFGNVANDSIFTIGPNTYEAVYSPDDLTFTVVPEPSTWGLAISGAGILIGIGKLRKRGFRA